MTTNARLRALVELADTGSVRGAAERLVVTESAISSALSSLSAEVGVPLVDRHGRGVRLTPAGQRYADYARKILGLHHEAVLAARGEVDPEHGSIRLAAVTTAGELLLPALLASFTAKYPDVDCKLEVAPRTAIWPMLSSHEADVVVAGRPPTDLDQIQRFGGDRRRSSACSRHRRSGPRRALPRCAGRHDRADEHSRGPCRCASKSAICPRGVPARGAGGSERLASFRGSTRL
jgi:DNA-binding transcriptional LysR family regulator